MTTINFSVAERSGGLVTSPDSATVTQSNTVLCFTLVGNAAQDYMFTGYTSTDASRQLGPPQINGDGTVMQVADANSSSEQFDITVLTVKRGAGTMHGADPVITNDPPK